MVIDNFMFFIKLHALHLFMVSAVLDIFSYYPQKTVVCDMKDIQTFNSGASRENRTPKGITRGILSALCLPVSPYSHTNYVR